MNSFLEITGSVITLIGSLFLLLGALGIVRMPDVYNRMQSGTKATTLGSMLFLLGIGIAHPTWMGKIILLILFIVFTNPVSSHVLARAAHYAGIKLSDRSVRDCLETDNLERRHNGNKDPDKTNNREECT